MNLKKDKPRVAITGAGGFIGGRVAERICLDLKLVPIILARPGSNLARVARFPIHIRPVDLAHRDSMKDALKDTDILIHCAFDSSWKGEEKISENLRGMEHLLSAAREARVRKLVHLSSMAVYGNPRDQIVNEKFPLHPLPDDPYSMAKSALQERVLSEAGRGGLECVVLQPTIVYGPDSKTWTRDPIERIRFNTLILYDEGRGICNALHVDNLVDAVFLAAERDGLNGECFIISDGAPVTWKDFYGYYARMLNRSLTEMNDEKKGRLKTMHRLQTATDRFLKGMPGQVGWDKLGRLAKSVVRTTVGKTRMVQSLKKKLTTIRSYHAGESDMMMSRTVFSIAKAVDKLGYRPRITLQEGMKQTEAWLRWTRAL